LLFNLNIFKNFNIGNFKSDIPSRFAAINTIIHELMHILGFSSNLYDKFIDSKGVIIPYNQIISIAKTHTGETCNII
jgi:hypothetical protein